MNRNKLHIYSLEVIIKAAREKDEDAKTKFLAHKHSVLWEKSNRSKSWIESRWEGTYC